MRTRLGEEVRHHKAFLSRLPDMPEPVPNAEQKSSALVIFPLFLGHEPTAIEDWLVRSACWARRSWLLHSDAVDVGVPLKFYVETQSMDRIVPILEACRVDIGEDVLFFDGGDAYPVLGKKGICFSDEQFSGYDCVFQFDADLFLAKPRDPKLNRCRFFRMFFRRCVTPLYLGVADFSYYSKLGKNVFGFSNWLNGLGLAFNKKRHEVRGHFVEVVNQFKGHDVDLRELANINGSIYAFPAAYLFKEYPEVCRSLTRMIGSLVNDEAGASVVADHYGLRLVSIMDEVGLQRCDLEGLRDFVNGGNYFLTHFGSNHEQKWRDAVGVNI